MKSKLLAVAVVELQHGLFSDTNNEAPHFNEDNLVWKVRICQDDLKSRREDTECIVDRKENDAVVCTGFDLYHIILQKCYQKSIQDLNNSHEDSTRSQTTSNQNGEEQIRDWSSYVVEIYHPKKCKFESLLDDHNRSCNVVETFGNRVRCIISYKDNNPNGNDVSRLNIELPQIMGRYFHYDSNGMDFAGKEIIVKEKINNQIDGTGLNVWDGALLMALYFEKIPDKVRSKSILELGSGTGFVGIAAAILDAREVVITDLEYTMELMKENVLRNEKSINCHIDQSCKKIKSHVCDWFNPPAINEFEFGSVHPDIILLADCVWVEDLVDPLMDTLELYCQEETIVYVTYQQRGRAAHIKFWSRLKAMFQTLMIIDTEKDCGLTKPESVNLIYCNRTRR